MKQKDLRIVMPQRGDVVNEVEVLGASAWLWMHSERHRLLALHHLNQMLLPVVRRGQYVLAFEAGKPVFFFSWAYFDMAAEQRWLADPDRVFEETDWNSGDRAWLIDWVAPYGHSRRMRYLLDEELFPHSCIRLLSRNGSGRRVRILQHRGRKVTHDEARAYFAARPLPLPGMSTYARILNKGHQG